MPDFMIRPMFRPPDPEVQWEGIVRRRSERAQARVRRRVGASMAAALVVVSLSSWAVTTKLSSHRDGLLPTESEVARVEPTSPELAPMPAPVPIVMPSAPPTDEPATDTLVRLSDGSMLRSTPGTRVDLCEADPADTCVALDRGETQVSAVPRSRGHLRVRAGAVEVRVIGTEFTVRRELDEHQDRVTVKVDEGRVEVSIGTREAQPLLAGEEWSYSTNASVPKRPSADDLWKAARAHSLRGEHAAAARSYQAFLGGFAEDPRASLAALELGRLRMDVLDDPAAAIVPLRRAARGTGPNQADAHARLVRALAAVGRQDECLAQRETYLERFPTGVHRRAVEQACGRVDTKSDP